MFSKGAAAPLDPRIGECVRSCCENDCSQIGPDHCKVRSPRSAVIDHRTDGPSNKIAIRETEDRDKQTSLGRETNNGIGELDP